MGNKTKQKKYTEREKILCGLLALLIFPLVIFGPPLSNHPFGSHFRKPTSFELRTYSNLAGARMRTVSLGLEAYRIDYGYFPVPRPMSAVQVPFMSIPLRLSLSGVMTYPDWEAVLFPVAVSNNKLTGLPSKIHDSYTANAELPFGYYTENDRWVLYAAGEDGVYSLLHPAIQIDWDADDWLLEQQRARVTVPVYDPTNGSWSAGDLFRFSED